MFRYLRKWYGGKSKFKRVLGIFVYFFLAIFLSFSEPLYHLKIFKRPLPNCEVKKVRNQNALPTLQSLQNKKIC